jgi:hypothetical protein
MPNPIPVTEQDVDAAWDRYHHYEIAGFTYERKFDHTDHSDRHVREQLRAVLENDRKRVAEQQDA